MPRTSAPKAVCSCAQRSNGHGKGGWATRAVNGRREIQWAQLLRALQKTKRRSIHSPWPCDAHAGARGRACGWSAS
eukprot:1933210-Prymnesium_polylepis.1